MSLLWKIYILNQVGLFQNTCNQMHPLFEELIWDFFFPEKQHHNFFLLPGSGRKHLVKALPSRAEGKGESQKESASTHMLSLWRQLSYMKKKRTVWPAVAASRTVYRCQIAQNVSTRHLQTPQNLYYPQCLYSLQTLLKFPCHFGLFCVTPCLGICLFALFRLRNLFHLGLEAGTVQTSPHPTSSLNYKPYGQRGLAHPEDDAEVSKGEPGPRNFQSTVLLEVV